MFVQKMLPQTTTFATASVFRLQHHSPVAAVCMPRTLRLQPCFTCSYFRGKATARKRTASSRQRHAGRHVTEACFCIPQKWRAANMRSQQLGHFLSLTHSHVFHRVQAFCVSTLISSMSFMAKPASASVLLLQSDATSSASLLALGLRSPSVTAAVFLARSLCRHAVPAADTHDSSCSTGSLYFPKANSLELETSRRCTLNMGSCCDSSSCLWKGNRQS